MLSQLFYKFLHLPYAHTASGADYAFMREEGKYYIYFAASNGATD